MRAAVPVVLGYLGIGIAAGVVERAAGLSYAEVLLLSTVLYAGSAQFVVTSMLSLASPASAIALTLFFLNLRHLLLSAALAPALRGVPAWKNALSACNSPMRHSWSPPAGDRCPRPGWRG